MSEISKILDWYGFTYEEARSARRDRKIGRARDHAIWHVWNTRYDPRRMSLVRIGDLFNKDHTSIRLAIGRHMQRNGIEHRFVEEVEISRGIKPRRGRPGFIDIAGKKYGRLTAVKPLGNSFWICRCDCGGTTKATRCDMESGNRKSCGCLVKQPIDMAGKRVGRLTAKHYAGKGRWLCVCDCGATSKPSGNALRRGEVKSCGCYAKELYTQRKAA
jgi:hypothetical protein